MADRGGLEVVGPFPPNDKPACPFQSPVGQNLFAAVGLAVDGELHVRVRAKERELGELQPKGKTRHEGKKKPWQRVEGPFRGTQTSTPPGQPASPRQAIAIINPQQGAALQLLGPWCSSSSSSCSSSSTSCVVLLILILLVAVREPTLGQLPPPALLLSSQRPSFSSLSIRSAHQFVLYIHHSRC